MITHKKKKNILKNILLLINQFWWYLVCPWSEIHPVFKHTCHFYPTNPLNALNTWDADSWHRRTALTDPLGLFSQNRSTSFLKRIQTPLLKSCCLILVGGCTEVQLWEEKKKSPFLSTKLSRGNGAVMSDAWSCTGFHQAYESWPTRDGLEVFVELLVSCVRYVFWWVN